MKIINVKLGKHSTFIRKVRTKDIHKAHKQRLQVLGSLSIIIDSYDYALKR